MDNIKVPKKVIDSFKKTFENGYFSEKYYKREYIRFFKYVYNSLEEFSEVDNEVLKWLSVEDRVSKVFNILETYVENLFKLNNVEYKEKYHYGSLNEVERVKLLNGLRKGDEYIDDTILGTSSFSKKIFSIFKSNKNTNDFDDSFLESISEYSIDNKELRFARILNIASNKFGDANKNNTKDIFKYIHDFSFKNDDCVKDAIDEILSDKKNYGGKKLDRDHLREDKMKDVEIPGMIEFEAFMRYDWFYLFTMYYHYYDDLFHIEKNDLFLDTLDENSDKYVEDEWGIVAYKNSKLYQESIMEFERIATVR